MTLLKGFAAGTPGFSIRMAKYGSFAVTKALELSTAPAERAQAVALLEVVRQVISVRTGSPPLVSRVWR